MLIKGIPWFLILLWSLNPQQKQKCFNFLCSSLGLQKTWIPPKGDEIRSRWPDRHLSSHPSPSAQGLRQAQTELLDWSRTHTHNEFPPSACVPVSVFDELWLARLRVSLQSGAAMLGQLSAAVGIIQTDRQKGLHPQAVIICWPMSYEGTYFKMGKFFWEGDAHNAVLLQHERSECDLNSLFCFMNFN